jgi:tetratricopeptide (TPR) repeat protein
MQYDFWQKSENLKTDVVTEHAGDDEAWARYQKLQARVHIPGLLWPARTSLKKHLAALAETTLMEYRNSDAPQITLKQWVQARTALVRALSIDPDDKDLRGKLLVCEGQIDRIGASSLKGDARQKRLNNAVSRFREAEGLLKNTPDAELGLARVYTYDLNNIEEAEAALEKAADKGHPNGKRESAQLADGYRRRADRIWRESRAFRALPDREQEYLEKAREDYMRAQELYQKTDLFGDAARNEMLALQGQRRVEQRLDELRTPSSSMVPQ